MCGQTWAMEKAKAVLVFSCSKDEGGEAGRRDQPKQWQHSRTSIL